MDLTVLQESEPIKKLTDDIVISEKEKLERDMSSGRLLGLIPVFILLLVLFVRIGFIIYKSNGQKTRNSQQRRTYMGSRQRPSVAQAEPTIYVSPANLPPPPKYEAMAPPSYEEVVGIHYPNFQPISQPISSALAQNSNTTEASNVNNVSNVSNVNNVPVVGNSNVNNNGDNVTNSNTPAPSTVISMTSERSPVTATS